MTCDYCPGTAVVFIGIGSVGVRLCAEHYDEHKATS